MNREKLYKIGDYYAENGKEGVVFEVGEDGKHGKIVSMTESSVLLQWTLDLCEQKCLVGANSRSDGSYNMERIMELHNWRTKYPAFKWCADLGIGWYLPAVDEFARFMFDDSVRDIVNHTLVARDGIKLVDIYNDEQVVYWSSTEHNVLNEQYGVYHAWLVYVHEKSLRSYSKYLCRRVRAVAKF